MWYKNKKILKAAAPFLDEGVFLLYPDLKIEIVTDAAYQFLKIPKEKSNLTLFHIPDSSISKKIETMLSEDKETDSVIYLEKSIAIRILSIEKSDLKLIIVKDDTGQEKILNMGKEFVGNASHELRTPITIIKGFTELLLETDGIERSMQKEILGKMFASCVRMEHLVNHLLRLTDLENCTAESFTEVDIHQLIEDVSYQVISIYPEVRIEHLRKDGAAKAFVDADLIELVLTNLFKNAVKYSRDEKLLTVTVDSSGDEIYIKVQDKGIGIPEKDLEKIFDRFYTVDKAHCRKLGGAGLGLSIVKLIVEKHKGKIYATSDLGLSTTMHLHLPKQGSKLCSFEASE
ncbi:MAG: Sensor histidine kinase WalK [Chlamydiia bacterium]|nr:Sensor histidine kinase WalK [Chlamydiia bacterium]MCH9623960.1 Sensor histidine kinase WalK [Chlamydiia bacterium]